MASKNFALAFQIGATFSGNQAFTQAATSAQRLTQTMKECQRQMKLVDAAYKQGSINLASRINAQNKIGAQYADAARQQANQQKFSQAKQNFSAGAQKMTQYGANAVQYAIMAKGIISVADAAVEFQGKMSKVQAITNSSTEEMEKLRAKAMELGSTTKFTSSQAADAMSYLGMAGWKTEQILAGMPGLLDLAAASGADLATTADIISDDLTAFGMSADQAGHMADVFAATSTNANTNVQMMGETFKYCAPLAGALKYDLEDVAVATGLMANAGIKATQAGTSLRSIFTRLAKPPKQAAIAMDALGISITNEDGTIKPFMQTMEELRDKFSGLNEEEKAQRAAQLAGQEAMSGFLAIVNAGEDDFKKLSAAITNCDGAASKMAGTMTNNAQGKIIAFQSAVDNLKIAIGDSMLPTLTSAAQAGSGLAETFGKLAGEYPSLIGNSMNLTLAIVALAAAGNAGAWAVTSLTQAWKGAKVVATGLQVALDAVRSGQVALTISTWATTAAQSAFAVGAKIAAAAQWIFNTALYGCPVVWIIAGIAAVVAAGYLLWKNWDTISAKAQEVWSWLKTAWSAIPDIISNAWSSITGTISNAWNAIPGVLSNAWNTVKTGAANLFNWVGNTITSLPGKIAYGIGYAIGYLTTAIPNVINSIVTWFQALPQRISEFIANMKASFDAFVSNAALWGVNMYNGLVTWFQQLPERASEAIATMIAWFESFVSNAALWGASVYTGIVNWVEQLPGQISETIDRILQAGRAFVEGAIQWGKDAVDGIVSWFKTLPSRLTGIISGIWDQVKNGFAGGAQAGSDAANGVEHNATGGIYNQGAFLTTFAEDSGESAIPHTPNARNIGLLAKTNEIMGNPLGAGGGSSITATFAPNITVQGAADAGQLQQVLETEMERFKKMLSELQSQQRRLSYA